ncbi:hypothetical protein BU24DRAFT_283650 [Aaosphaeria arxii CBS 175.79]|uniref:LIM zinc-binding domain-containing protein n=1 Tax=Aaosphaeria arxii CBS 175.79 TaxID=1450172 RepID=A0A6A5XF44_9PLEO|nr:uncharacterized protein BU24DRAFT_283650 [Aaosphaeria arxii CBS 175.79]KAF2011553.1 hypothetical protein BU24DRAFT_283650 [Aaosphaeria arxii CBS 175.79]
MADGLKIKCSTCGVDIDIAQLADHICAPASASTRQDDSLASPALNRAATFGSPTMSFNSTQDQPRGGRTKPPPMIDSAAANKPFYPQKQLSPNNPYNDPRSLSPVSPGSRPSMNRSATSPVPQQRGPPPPNMSSNMDSAFPPFPSARTGTPMSSRTQYSERSKPSYRHQYAEASPQYAPLSPRFNGGAAIAKRMDSIAPGPFDGSDRRPSTADERGAPQNMEFGHRRTATQGSVKSIGRSANTRTSLASTASRTSAYSSTTNGLPSRPRPGRDGVPELPPPPPPPVVEKTEGIDAFLDRLQKETMGAGDRPRTSHSRNASRNTNGSPPRPIRPEDIDRALPRLPVFDTSAPRPNNEFPVRSTSRGGSKLPARLDTQQPLLPPLPTNPLHTPSDSGQSDDSYSSAGFASVASSRSSPPTSEPSHSRNTSKVARVDYGREQEDIPRADSPESFLDPRTPPKPLRRNEPAGFDRPGISESLLPPQPSFFNPPESPMDPAIQRGLDYSRRPSPTRMMSRGDDELMLPPPPPVPQPESRAPPTRRPTAASKGNCRGCSNPIIGKSIKDSSGRLTGRYHKECFSCRTCRSPFPTADFYVFNNFPYCEHHYHQLNGSLCKTCNRGIEGQYLETDARLKFHPRCFTCLTCRVILRDDYFEVGGRAYCERHAFAAQRSNHGLFPGENPSRNMQKRRTRLMMM